VTGGDRGDDAEEHVDLLAAIGTDAGVARFRASLRKRSRDPPLHAVDRSADRA